MRDNPVLRVVAKIIVPAIFLFALYVQFHGDYGPGGGFQAGVIFASSFILYGIIFGIAKLRQVIHPSFVRSSAAFGVLIYVGVGIVTILNGGEFLNYNVLSQSAEAGQHIGIMIIEFGVGLTVASTMIILFFAFAKP